MHRSLHIKIKYKTYNYATINQLRKRDAARLCKRGRVFHQRRPQLDDALQWFILRHIPRPAALWQRAACRHHERCVLFHQRRPFLDVALHWLVMRRVPQPCRWRPRTFSYHQQRPVLLHQHRQKLAEKKLKSNILMKKHI